MSYPLSRSPDNALQSSSRALGRWLERWLSERFFSRLSIGARITTIALTLAVPLNLVIIAVIWHLSEAASESQRSGLLYTARSVAAAVDAKLGEYMTLAQALGRSPALLQDNLDVFEAEARRAFTGQDAWVAVSDLEGQQLINTLKQPGQRLAHRNSLGLAPQKRALETHSILVTDVRLGQNSQDWIITIEVPIFKNGQPFRALSAAVRAKSFFSLLNDQHMPKNWLGGIVDGQNCFIAHVPSEGRSTGQLASEGSRNLKDKEGVFEFASIDGSPIVLARANSAKSDWTAGIAVKKAEMQAAAWEASRWAMLLGASFSVLSLLLAGAMARSITNPIDKLRKKVMAGHAPSMPSKGPPEVRDLWQSLRQAAADRDQSEEARRESEERLRLSNQAAGIGTFTVTLETGCVHYSPELAIMLGFPEVRTTNLDEAFSRVHRDDLCRFRAQFEAGLSGVGAGQIKADFRFVRPGGEIRWMTWAGHVHFREGASGRMPFRIDGACVDITERKRAEAALRDSEERFRGVFQHAVNGIVIRDMDERFLSCNPAYTKMLGYSEEELRALAFPTYVHPEDQDENIAACKRLAAGEISSYEIVNRYVCKDSKSIWVHKFVSLLRDNCDKPTSILVLVTDITGQKLSEAALRESEERFRGVFENAATGIAILSLEGRFQSCNPAFSAMLGYSEEELRQFNFAELVHPEDRDANMAECQRLLMQEIPFFEIVMRYRRKDGKPSWAQKYVSLLRDGTGKPTHILALVTDITGQKLSQAALSASEERFRGIFEHAGTGIAIADMEGWLQTGNPAYCNMLGYTKEELRELTVRDLMHADDLEECMCNFHRLVTQEIPSFETLNRYVAKDGKPVWVHKHVSLLRDDRGTPVSAMALVTDITEHKRQDDQIRLLMREVNHRSKNMLALVQAVARQTLTANPQDFLDRFGRRVEALAASQDLLVKNAWKGVDLEDLVRSQLAPFEDLAGTRITLHGPPLFVSASAAQAIGMAVHELATNAGKYGALSGAKGRVEITWCIEREDPDGQVFIMNWREQSAQSIVPPAKQGFGSSVIGSMTEMSLGAKVELSFPPTGLTWELRCPADEVLDGGI
ncbi:MAG: PAS domain S-box protein, partial [Rhodomicrobium sp.]